MATCQPLAPLELEPLAGESAALRDARRRLALAAPAETTVLLLGETGTGKGVAAAALHARSRRAAGPFVHVDCAALSPSLIESELFGHERGAFTGALAPRTGRLGPARLGRHGGPRQGYGVRLLLRPV
jgi:transcriptional regulator with GAF, ATPase, and Fis domain